MLAKKSFCAVYSFVRGTLKLTDIIELSQLKTNSILIIVLLQNSRLILKNGDKLRYVARC